MPKLFVAVDLPAIAIAELVRIQPRSLVGLRLSAANQMHLTLHYVGEANVDRLASALSTVAATAFAITIEGVGQFPSANGATTLWAGIQENSELLRLHAAIADSLAVIDYRTETRRYTPHITLARCSPEILPGFIDEFLALQEGFLLQDVSVNGFALYSSVLDGDVPVYKSERSFQG